MNPKKTVAQKTTIVHVPTAAEAVSYKNQGFTPVECCFGSTSIVDDLLMDHHNRFDHLGPVCNRAYNEYFGARRHDPRFVVTGKFDKDVTFAIAALSGQLPHRCYQRDQFNRAMHRDLSALAEMVAKRDDEANGQKKVQQLGLPSYGLSKAKCCK